MLPPELLREALQERLVDLDAGKGRKRSQKPVRVEDLLRRDPALAEAVARVRGKMGSVPDVRTERVDELKERLKGGCLDMDSHSVAEKLLYETILDELL